MELAKVHVIATRQVLVWRKTQTMVLQLCAGVMGSEECIEMCQVALCSVKIDAFGAIMDGGITLIV